MKNNWIEKKNIEREKSATCVHGAKGSEERVLWKELRKEGEWSNRDRSKWREGKNGRRGESETCVEERVVNEELWKGGRVTRERIEAKREKYVERMAERKQRER